MAIIRDVLPDTILAQISNLAAPVSDKVKVSLTCACGAVKEIGTRALKRKWADKVEYLCKSCHVKTYASKPERIVKFQKSFAKTARTELHRKKCSEAGKKPWQSPETRTRIIEAIRQDNKTNPLKKRARKIALEALKAKPWFRQHMANMRLSQRNKPSILENIIAKLLDDYGVEYTQQFKLGYYNYDFLVKSAQPFLLEVQGEYWHSDTCARDSAKATYAARAGYIIHHIWEHEFSATESIIAKIKSWSGEQEILNIPFELADISVKRIETYDARVFLGAYHYLPAISKFGFHVGAYLEGQLIAVCTYSSLTRKESAVRLGLTTKQVRELSRFCIHPARHQKNFASWFLSRATKLFVRENEKVKVKAIISFADTTQGHVGTIYRATNWIFDGATKPSYSYIAASGHIAHKKTIWDRAKKLSMSEAEYAELNGYVKLAGKKKNRYILLL